MKIIVYSPNMNPELRTRLKMFAFAQFPNATTVLERVDAFVDPKDLEPADAIVYLPGKREQIGAPYEAKGILTRVYDPNAPLVPAPPEPPKIEEVAPAAIPVFAKPLPEIPVIKVGPEAGVEPAQGRRRK